MATIPTRRLAVELHITVEPASELRIAEEMTLPATDTDFPVAQIAAVGRVVQSFARRYDTDVDALLEPLRDAAEQLGTNDELTEQLRQWRNAAVALLAVYTTGQPLDFGRQPIPDAVRDALMEHQGRFLPAANSGDASTEVLPRLRVFYTGDRVPEDVNALRYNGVGSVGIWYRRHGVAGDEWYAAGPHATDNGGTVFRTDELLDGREMVAVDPRTGDPS